jgi:hypothetical protein
METESRPDPGRFHVDLQIATNRDTLGLSVSSKSNVDIAVNVWKAGNFCNFDCMFVIRIQKQH